MSDTHRCPDRPHVHPMTLAIVPRSWSVVGAAPNTFVLAGDQNIAERIATLIDRHGLIDIPDGVGWPAPTGPAVDLPAPTLRSTL